jgi:hypothetical protein
MSRNIEGGESGERGQAKEQPHQRLSYLDARRYLSAEAAGKAYLESQEAIRRDAQKAELSVYRVLLGPLFQSHEVVSKGDWRYWQAEMARKTTRDRRSMAGSSKPSSGSPTGAACLPLEGQ